jgi:hypothetical protein
LLNISLRAESPQLKVRLQQLSRTASAWMRDRMRDRRNRRRDGSRSMVRANRTSMCNQSILIIAPPLVLAGWDACPLHLVNRSPKTGEFRGVLPALATQLASQPKICGSQCTAVASLVITWSVHGGTRRNECCIGCGQNKGQPDQEERCRCHFTLP